MSDTEAKNIRFIDSQYNTLFFVPDGGNIILTYSDGEKLTRPCKFLDEYHTQIGSSVYHICEFAEKMERIGATYAPEQPPALPDRCFSTLPSSGELIIIEKNKKGYGQCGFSTPSSEQNKMLADKLNARNGVTRQQEAAMLGGSLFGWATPAAKTSSYDVRGNPIKPQKAKRPRQKGIER
jgi:hypothetical protein